MESLLPVIVGGLIGLAGGIALKRIQGNYKELSDGHPEAYQTYMEKREEVLNRLGEFTVAEFAASSVSWKLTKKVAQYFRLHPKI